MCGIAGFLGGEWPGSEVAQILERMNFALRHRGPDDSGIWTDKDSRVGFTHDRLSILDLSPTGKQPMHSHSGRYVITYNGEIYNHLELRAAVPALAWRGTSDTESLLAAIEHFGPQGAVERATGMFAFALWDRKNRSLMLARDRLGEKPLYYGTQTGTHPVFLFASELKAIAAHPSFEGRINRKALTLFLRFGYVPAPFSIYEGIHKLPPGSILTINNDSAEPIVTPYWSGLEVAKAGVSRRISGSEEEIVDQLEFLLGDVIERQMLADVPVGAFLSGGIDSSTIVAIMQNLSTRPVNTFTVGFHEKSHDEADHARAVARHLGTDHVEVYVTSDEARAIIPRLPEIYDEPFADSSQIPMFFISALARSKVKVALSGDGGDELFGGYNRHLAAQQIWSRVSQLPRSFRRSLAAGLVAVPAPAWSILNAASRQVLPRSVGSANLGETVRRWAPLLGSNSLADLYKDIVAQWRDPVSVVLGSLDVADDGVPAFDNLRELTPGEQLMAADTVGYLPDDVLVKVDRAAMAVSLETRVPFLDHRVVEFAWRLPLGLKIQGNRTKAILRRLLYRHVPSALVDRPKMGFAVPISEWLRGPLREWAEALLDPRLLREQGFFDAELVDGVWRGHLDGTVDEKRRLWAILMFQSWLVAQQSTVAPGNARR
jgi:asparagine synthase (glutamine-hydrolysing)